MLLESLLSLQLRQQAEFNPTLNPIVSPIIQIALKQDLDNSSFDFDNYLISQDNSKAENKEASKSEIAKIKQEQDNTIRLEIYNEITQEPIGKASFEKARNYYENLDRLKAQVGTRDISGGRSGYNSKTFLGEPNSVYRAGRGRIVITDEAGKAILDISLERVKVYVDSRPGGDRGAGIIKRRDFKMPHKQEGKFWNIEEQPYDSLIDFIKRFTY